MRLSRKRDLTRPRRHVDYSDINYRLSRYQIKPYRLVPPLGRVFTDPVRREAVKPKPLRIKKSRVVIKQPERVVRQYKPNVVTGYVVRQVRRQVRRVSPGRFLPDCKRRREYRKGMMKKLAAQVRKASGQGALARWRGKLIKKIVC